MNAHVWLESDVPEGLAVRQVYGFILNQVGQILLFEDAGLYNLPGGKPEHDETVSETLIREAKEEVQVTITAIDYLGYQLITDNEDFAQVRLVCLVDEIFPIEADPGTGRDYSRLWVPPTQANALLNWGESGAGQIKSAMKAASKLGVIWDGSPISRIDTLGG